MPLDNGFDKKESSFTRPDVIASILFYFCSTIALTVFNKWFFSVSALQFHFPLTVTFSHQALVFVFTNIFETVLLEKVAGKITRGSGFANALCPIGVLCCLDWGTSNYALNLIPLSLYEMLKATTPMWVLFFSIITSLSRPTIIQLGVYVCITVGTYLAVCGDRNPKNIILSPHFPLVGAACCLVGAFFAGARSITTQVVMHNFVEPRTHKCQVNAVTTMYYAAPAAAVTLLIPVLGVESDGLFKWFSQASSKDLLWLAGELIGSAGIAFCVSISGFLLTKRVSAMTFSAVQLAERVMIVALAIILFKDNVGIVNAIGFLQTLCGIILFNYYMIVAARKGIKDEIKRGRKSFGFIKQETPQILQRRTNCASANALILADYQSAETLRTPDSLGSDDEWEMTPLREMSPDMSFPGSPYVTQQHGGNVYYNKQSLTDENRSAIQPSPGERSPLMRRGTGIYGTAAEGTSTMPPKRQETGLPRHQFHPAGGEQKGEGEEEEEDGNKSPPQRGGFGRLVTPNMEQVSSGEWSPQEQEGGEEEEGEGEQR